MKLNYYERIAITLMLFDVLFRRNIIKQYGWEGAIEALQQIALYKIDLDGLAS